jgi:hypothetical protein
MRIPIKLEMRKLTSNEKLQGHPKISVVMMGLPAISVLLKSQSNEGELEYARILRLGDRGCIPSK